MLKAIQKTNIVLAGILFLVLTTLFISTPTHAEKAKYQTEIENVLQVSFPSNIIHVRVDPGTKPFDSADFPVTVSTNNFTGYYMTITSDTTDLLKTDNVLMTIPTLPELEGGYTQDTFEVNKWGYKVGDGNYKPFVSGERIAGADTTINGDVTNLNFATKVNFDQDSGIYENVLTFFAVANPLPTFIQNLDTSLCTTDPMTVVDNRDNEEYIVQRLDDGNCWMMNNLRLGANEITTDLNKFNTNVSNTVTAETFNSWRDRPLNAQTYFYVSNTEGEMIQVYPYSHNIDENTNMPWGVAYNYCAASAGTYCYPTSAEPPASSTYDICPAGWRLPTGGSGGEFENLYNQPAYNSAEKMIAPISEGGLAFHDHGTQWPGYWSSTLGHVAYDGRFMYALDLGSGTPTINPNAQAYATWPSYMRCVLDPTMQGFSDADANRLAEGQSIILTDSRDKQQYSVTKINGNVWMTKNLAIGCDGVGGTYGSNPTGITLDPSDTELPNEFTMPTAALANIVEPRMQCSDTYGAWYNYYTAMGNTIQQSYEDGSYYNAAEGTPEHELYELWRATPYSVCPAGWYMPGEDEVNSIAGADYVEAFKPVLGGDYWPYTDTIDGTDLVGEWWSSTGFGNANRGAFLYRASSNELEAYFYSGWGTVGPWAQGMYIRCIYRTNS